jgi:hypothetical protein
VEEYIPDIGMDVWLVGTMEVGPGKVGFGKTEVEKSAVDPGLVRTADVGSGLWTTEDC